METGFFGDQGQGAVVVPLRRQFFGPVTQPLLILLGTVAFVSPEQWKNPAAKKKPQMDIYAAALVVGATQRAESLARFPQRGRTVPEYQQANVREVFVGSYRLIYRILPETISIIAFVHSARDLSGLLAKAAE